MHQRSSTVTISLEKCMNSRELQEPSVRVYDINWCLTLPLHGTCLTFRTFPLPRDNVGLSSSSVTSDERESRSSPPHQYQQCYRNHIPYCSRNASIAFQSRIGGVSICFHVKDGSHRPYFAVCNGLNLSSCFPLTLGLMVAYGRYKSFFFFLNGSR